MNIIDINKYIIDLCIINLCIINHLIYFFIEVIYRYKIGTSSSVPNSAQSTIGTSSLIFDLIYEPLLTKIFSE